MDILQIRNRSMKLSSRDRQCIRRLKSLMEHNDTYRMHVIQDGSIDSMLDESDRYRFRWLASHPDGLYVDIDCFVKSIPIGVSGKAWFPNKEDRVDIFFIKVNGDTGFINREFNRKPKKKGKFYGWPAQELKRIYSKRKYNVIPSNFYDHAFTTLTRLTKANREIKCQVST